MVADGDRHGRRVLVRLPCSLQQKRPIRVACDDEMDEVVVGVASMTVGSKRQRTEESEGEVGRCDDEGAAGDTTGGMAWVTAAMGGDGGSGGGGNGDDGGSSAASPGVATPQDDEQLRGAPR